MKRIACIALGCLVAFISLCAKANDINEQERRDKIEKMASWYSNVAQDQAAPIKQAAGAIALQVTLQLGAGSKRWGTTNPQEWGPNNPNWKPVYERVNLDTQEEIRQFIAGPGKELGSVFQTKFADELSMDDVNALTAFSKTDKGKRYWALSNQLSRLTADTTSHLSDWVSNKPPSQPTADELQSWVRFIKVSNSTQVIEAMIGKDKLAGLDTSGSNGIWFMLAMVMASHQDDFRQIASTYGNDLDEFTAFNGSPVGKRLVEAQVTTAVELKPKMNEIMVDFMAKVNAHQNSWKEMYEKVVSVNSPDVAANRPSVASKRGQSIIDGIDFKLGEDIASVKAALHTDLDPEPMERNASLPASVPDVNKGKTILHLRSKGIWVFFDKDGKAYTIRLDAPFAAEVLGIKVGDSLEKVTSTLGKPIKTPWASFFTMESYQYVLDDSNYVIFDVSDNAVNFIFITK